MTANQKPYHYGENRQDRIDRHKHATGARRSYSVVWPPRDPADLIRPSIGHNGAPRYDPDIEITGAPMVLRDIAEFDAGDGTIITSRSGLRKLQQERGIEQVGLEVTACSDVGRPDWFDEYKSHRRERERAKKLGKADPGTWKQRKAREAKAKAKA